MITVKVRFTTPEAFIAQYRTHVLNGRFFLSSTKSLPIGTPAQLFITIPGFTGAFVITGVAESIITPGTTDNPDQSGGIVFCFSAGQEDRLKRLNEALSNHESYRELMSSTRTLSAVGFTHRPDAPGNQTNSRTSSPRPSPSGSENRFEWLRNVIQDRDSVGRLQQPEETKTPLAAPTGDRVKKDFTPQERDRLRPVSEFILSLVKAMLRSGYYAPEHPGSKKAKAGIYMDFKTAVGDQPDITLVSRDTQGRFDIMVSGILDDQVSLRGLVGIEQAEIYMPKLKDYFARKNLVSFSLKRDLPLPHFEDFIDIMSDPMREKGAEGEVGSLLTSALVERGISEVSAIFIDDMIIFELKLPWRVEMAIQRLAKDLKVLPLFKDKTAEEIQQIKIHIIQDIIRPLREPHMLKDIVVNAHVIARNVAAVDAEDLEKTIVKTFPMEILIPTSKYVFEELGRIKDELSHKAGHKGLLNRFESVKRILRWISARVLNEKIAAGELFFEQLYFQKILTYEELPQEVKDHVDTMTLVSEFKELSDLYIERFSATREKEDLILFLRFFRRILPPLLEKRDYQPISLINGAVFAKFEGQGNELRNGHDSLADPIRFIWMDSLDVLARLFEDETSQERNTIEKTIRLLGPSGVSLLISVLMSSHNRFVRKSAVEALVGMGKDAHDAILNILLTPSNPWYVMRNALLAFSRLGKPEEARIVEPFIRNENPRVREEALNTLAIILGPSVEPTLLRALSDPDINVRIRAVGCMKMFPLTSNRVVFALIDIIMTIDDKHPDQREKFVGLKVEAIHALSAIGNVPVQADKRVEDILIELILPDKRWSQKLVDRIKHSVTKNEDNYIIQTAALKSLWKIGTSRVIPSLQEFIEKADVVMVNRVKETIRQIQTRR